MYRYHHGSACKRFWVTEGETAETLEGTMAVLFAHIDNCDECQEIRNAPLWWDDASYIRYQSDCGDDDDFLPLLFGGYHYSEVPDGPLLVSLVNYTREWKREADARLVDYLPETDDIPF